MRRNNAPLLPILEDGVCASRLLQCCFRGQMFFCLDEPTNYLDLEGTLWLENFISRYEGTVLIISHDRDLLNTAVNSILHLEQRQLVFYRGNYDGFARKRSAKQELAQKAQAKQEARRKHMQAFVDRFRYTASKARQAQSRLKMLEKIQPIGLGLNESSAPIRFPAPEKLLASPIIRLEKTAAGYAADNPVLKNVNLRIDQDEPNRPIGCQWQWQIDIRQIAGKPARICRGRRYPRPSAECGDVCPASTG